MRLRSSSAATCTRARPEPTTPATISSTCAFRRRSIPACFSSTAMPARCHVALCPVGEEAAALVDDRDALGLEALDRGGDEVAHGADLRGVELAPELQHDRGPRRLAVALEQAALRHDEMDARALDPADRADGARQLALERAEMVDALDEARRGEGIALVEDLVADAAAGRQALPASSMRMRARSERGTRMVWPSPRVS